MSPVTAAVTPTARATAPRPRPSARTRRRFRARYPGRAHRGAVAALLAAAVTAVTLSVPGATAPAHAQSCRTQVRGEELPDSAGPHPLIDLLGLRHAWDLSTGDGVTVAVVDSGVDARHPDLAGAVTGGSRFDVTRDAAEFTRTTPAADEDCEGHGTGIAGLVAARRAEGDRMTGVAPAARVHPIRSVDGVDRATHNTVAAMIDDAVDAGVEVLNLSLAVVEDHAPIREAVARAVAADIVVVAAAGNEGNSGPSGGRVYPAAYPDVLAVGAVDAAGRPLDASNRGPWVDLAAYGGPLPLVAPGGSGYRTDSGTSFAAAQVSGAAALVRARYPDLTAAETAERLVASAAPVGGTRNDRTGAGIVDPFGALTHLPHLGPDDPEGEGAGIAVQPLPTTPPLLDRTEALALASAGALLLALLLGLVAAPGVRRAATRGWRTGPLPDTAPAGGPAPAPTRPRGAALERLDGSDVPPPVPPGRNRAAVARSRTPTTHRSR
ncbi:S8 family serine peptidase [Streptomyces bohaiensis]|uniref:S8 family serine peptidase n=1 Tax=Streptomyces bohaiensis TaxID=1431344 RepID=A0ABX1CCW0_9ACTN|nr:S8 family serine peptidase [Streptomyces bohaiensis]NJQ15710.1 S8 family serine peptidase [Streptomyces bohaiensis]